METTTRTRPGMQAWAEYVILAAGIAVATIAVVVFLLTGSDETDHASADRNPCNIIGIGLVEDPDCRTDDYLVEDALRTSQRP